MSDKPLECSDGTMTSEHLVNAGTNSLGTPMFCEFPGVFQCCRAKDCVKLTHQKVFAIGFALRLF